MFLNPGGPWDPPVGFLRAFGGIIYGSWAFSEASFPQNTQPLDFLKLNDILPLHWLYSVANAHVLQLYAVYELMLLNLVYD